MGEKKLEKGTCKKEKEKPKRGTLKVRGTQKYIESPKQGHHLCNLNHIGDNNAII